MLQVVFETTRAKKDSLKYIKHVDYPRPTLHSAHFTRDELHLLLMLHAYFNIIPILRIDGSYIVYAFSSEVTYSKQ